MAQSFFWYDLETSGRSARNDRVMQFAGQRTDLDLNPVGEPVNVLIKMSDDVLPDPEAILLTGITPQQTLQDGVTEAEFLRQFREEIATPGTIFVGFNTVRFDDEFMRFLHYRNFYDAYEWQWKDGNSRWDLLDMARMTRALRPDGIQWPKDKDGNGTNRLELLTKLNGLDHEHAHDALNDVLASIAVAKLIKTKQPKLFEWLLNLRGKNDVKKFLDANPTCLYTSGRYDNAAEKTAAVRVLHVDDTKGALVYDLRYDPTEFNGMSAEDLMERWRYTKDPDAPPRLPVKTLKFNRCPALSPLGPLKEPEVQERLKVTPVTVQANLKKLAEMPDLVANIVRARNLLDDERGEEWSKEKPDADTALYGNGGGFFDDNDKRLMSVVRAAKPDELTGLSFHDHRLEELLPRYKARNFSGNLTDEERAAWEDYRYHLLLDGGTESRLARFAKHLGELAETDAAAEKRYLLEELQLYAESIMPVTEAGQ
ncbi:MAG TPA: exodeoxyribonuclease I [Candidatus Saccharimonadales bacterium]|nr:exodeoxyribonuclease I [Candidatus Saccharimonadales bacterium]